jgi:mRNA-degrading endonuclease toxin of MazEF toxin-antitoxin module
MTARRGSSKHFPFKRGDVYLIRFPLPDQPDKAIDKFAVNLQEGAIVDRAPSFVCVLITTLKGPTSTHLYPADVLLTPDESQTDYGAKVICNQIHTVHKSRILAHKYTLSAEAMHKIDGRLLMGIGLIKWEEVVRSRS